MWLRGVGEGLSTLKTGLLKFPLFNAFLFRDSQYFCLGLLPLTTYQLYEICGDKDLKDCDLRKTDPGGTH